MVILCITSHITCENSEESTEPTTSDTSFDNEGEEFTTEPIIVDTEPVEEVDVTTLIPDSDLENERESIMKFCQAIKYTTKFLPHAKDCSKYYMCHNSQATIFKCAPGHFFDMEYLSCLSTKIPCGSIKFQENTIEGGISLGYKRDTKSCDTYIQYGIENFETVKCKSGKHFDFNEVVCK